MRRGSWVERSGLMMLQLVPPFVVLKMTWAPKKTALWSKGSMANGGVQWARYLSLLGSESSVCIQGLTERASLVLWS